MIKLNLQFFGGRGAGSSTGGGKGASGELVLPNGSKIEFEGTLQYGGNDAALTGTARQNVTQWEGKRVKNKVEYAYATDANGNPVGAEIRGSKGSVRVPRRFHENPDGTFTHIHPREDGLLGGTFSQQDLLNFANYSTRTVRAAAKEGTYSISKGKNFDKYGFKNYIGQAQKAFNKSYSDKISRLGKLWRGGKISYDEYLKGNAKAFNTALVELHNAYRKGQNTYGYSYTLEKSN